jgi:hypothetical protein
MFFDAFILGRKELGVLDFFGEQNNSKQKGWLEEIQVKAKKSWYREEKSYFGVVAQKRWY